MAYITIETRDHGGVSTLHERLSCDDLDSALFCDHLIERVRWAVEDTEPPDDLLESAPPASSLADGMLALVVAPDRVHL